MRTCCGAKQIDRVVRARGEQLALVATYQAGQQFYDALLPEVSTEDNRGRISGIMGDTAKGIKAFREGLKGEEESEAEEPPAKPLPKTAAKTASASRAKTKA